ncbi:MAG: glycoside hydrolase family 125 protein, partial [Pseudonocardia sp.]|nr:glycoside hydrolase family 125 protein [Pseudonocardia sp.]
CASFGNDGTWLSLGGPHPEVGFVELNGLPPFDEATRGNPALTRRYRRWMSESRFGFLTIGTDTAMPPGAEQADASDPARPRWSLTLPGIVDDVDAVADERGITWRHRLRRTGAAAAPLRLRFVGRLDRPALAEITEVNPPAPTGADTVLRAEGATLHVAADALAARVELAVTSDPPGPLAWQARDGHAELEIGWPPEVEELTVEVTGRLDVVSPPVGSAPEILSVPADLVPRLRSMVERALIYVRTCAALAVTADQRAILTDHRLLPLSWTRDAYFQAMLLLATGASADTRLVADHLRWLWLRCERPDARWMRSHHADGRRKDLAFQIDQQLYPILELADYRRATGSAPTGVAWPALVREAWDAAVAEVDPATCLAATTENAADDEAPLPFILSSQILLWHTARQLAELADAGLAELDAAQVLQFADRIRAAVDRHLPTDDGWAYATDAGAGRVRYHDANDLPTAFAPLWGFCAPEDPTWLATVRFAFSPANPGYFDGEFGGLGSLHTPGVWPLGDIQAWVCASLTGDRRAADGAVRRLCETAFDDGMLPEAYDAATGLPIARDWFAWPGALLGALVLLDQRGQLGRST